MIGAVGTLALGLAIGLAAGVSPGPLLVLVVTESLRSGRRAGVLTAAAPLATDAVVIAGVVLVLHHLPSRALPVLGVVGGCYVVWSAGTTWREAGSVTVEPVATVPVPVAALRRVAVVNVLSPHPWIAWATALGPLTVQAWRSSPGAGIALVAGFYLGLVGTKAVLAVLVAGGRHRLSGAGYQRALRGSAVLLAAAGVALVVEFAPQALGG